jgi:hypothetical protein
MRKLIFLWVLLFSIILAYVFVTFKWVHAEEYLKKGDYELMFTAGGGKGAKVLSSEQAHNLMEANVSLGYVATDNFFKGKFYQFNFEPVVELTPFGYQYNPKSGHYAGGSLIGRINFTNNKDKKLIPYLEGGVGLTYTSISPDLAGPREFNYQVEGGARYFLTKHLSIDTGLRWRHISCAGTLNDGFYHRNNGVNSLVLLQGISLIW